MDTQVNTNQLEKVIIKWLNKYFGDLTPKKHKDHPNSVFYVNSDNEVLMEYNQENEHVFIHYNNLWSKIESLFYLNYDDTKSVIRVWMEEDYNLEGITPMITLKPRVSSLE